MAIAVAILNHGLYDLRRAAHRTLMWLTMSGAVAGIYAVVVIASAALVPDHHAWWPSALAAGLAALLLIPLRESLQRAVNRVVYGRWHEPYEVLAGLGERLEAAADVDRLLDAVLAELTTGLDLRDVGVLGPRRHRGGRRHGPGRRGRWLARQQRTAPAAPEPPSLFRPSGSPWATWPTGPIVA